MLALGPRRPSDIMITPQGFVTCCSLSFTDGSPDANLHRVVEEDDDPDEQRPVFASVALTRDMLSVLGQLDYSSPLRASDALSAVPGITFLYRAGCVELSPMTLQLLLIAKDAFLAVRSRGVELVAAYGAAMVSGKLAVWWARTLP